MPLSSDIYGITEMVNDLKKKYTSSINDETLYMGIFGYMGDVFSLLGQNSIVVASEYSNESIPSKAKFEKNIITQALSLGFTDIDAIPSVMTVLMGFLEKELIDNMVDNEFTFDKDSKFFIEDFEFHLDYDLIITRNILTSSVINYSARYNLDEINPLSDIDYPYLTPPIRMNVSGQPVVFVQCNIRQVEDVKVYKKLLSNNPIENKTLSFDFTSQVATFIVEVTENGVTTYLTPVYEGAPIGSLINYCYYSYIDSDTVRVKFASASYEPKINADITINIKTTQGANGNFTYKDDISYTFSSEKYVYENITCTIKPMSDAEFGSDKKSIEELKRIIPKEASSRGSITNDTDLVNFFNAIDTPTNKVYFFPKIDNQFERTYYSYIVLKNSLDNIIPTNTIEYIVYEEDLIGGGEDINLAVEPGNVISIQPDGTYKLSNEPADAEFKYTTPFLTVINKDPLYVSYYMTTFNVNKFIGYIALNPESPLQFIATSANWKREYLTDKDTYKLNVPIVQNILSDIGMIVVDDDGNIVSTKIKAYLILYREGVAYRYLEGTIVKYDPEVFSYNIEFDFITKDIMSSDNKIRIENVKDLGTDTEIYGYLDGETETKLYLLAEQDKEYGRGEDIDKWIPGLTGYSLTNEYKIESDLNFYTNYSKLISSYIDVAKDAEDKVYYTISSAPVIKSDYIDEESKITDLSYQLSRRKAYIDYALEILEDSMGIDFKFFNTYGKSKIFAINSSTLLNNISITMTFDVKFVNNSDNYLVENITYDIKSYVEDIEEVNNLHIPNIITLITNNYRDQLVYFEFKDINGYGPGEQHIYTVSDNSIVDVPELINIAVDEKGLPKVIINIV